MAWKTFFEPKNNPNNRFEHFQQWLERSRTFLGSSLLNTIICKLFLTWRFMEQLMLNHLTVIHTDHLWTVMFSLKDTGNAKQCHIPKKHDENINAITVQTLFCPFDLLRMTSHHFSSCATYRLLIKSQWTAQ